ncbi:MAG: nucleotidyltransferase family protein [Thermogutta sp.]|nr:nucleotidyltransferase family protein [Thermogutta sp.]
MTDKALILARGLGTRMRKDDQSVTLSEAEARAAATGVKAMIPIDRPFLDYVLSALADAGYRRICLVVAPDHDVIRRYYQEECPPQRLTLDFAVQEVPRGTADAVAAGEAFADGDDILVVNSDNYYPLEALGELRQRSGSAVALFEQEAMLRESNIAPERIKAFAVGLADGDGNLVRILEKPDETTLAALPRPLWLSMNCWRFSPAIFEACRRIPPSPRGEYEITDAVQYCIDRLGVRFQVVRVPRPVLDMTSRADIPAIKERLKGVRVRL